jgi:Methyltransferase domain
MSARTDRVWDLLFRAMPVRVFKSAVGFLHRHPQIADTAGFHIRQNHFYEPLPDFSKITRDAVMKRREGQGVNWNQSAQPQWATALAFYAPEIAEIRAQKSEASRFDFGNEMFGFLDAAIYYATVRALKPSRIIEIGSGYSTQIACIALQKNVSEGKPGRMTCIEPYPPPWLHGAGMEVELLKQPVETVDLGVFKELKDRDILFIDSTHTVKFQSDVCREFLDILPQLAVGVCVHVHDIFFPYDYPPEWLIDQRRAWNEQYLLEAFLAFNSDFEILLANHFLGVDHPEIAAQILGQPAPTNFMHQAGSFWMRRKCRSVLG